MSDLPCMPLGSDDFSLWLKKRGLPDTFEHFFAWRGGQWCLLDHMEPTIATLLAEVDAWRTRFPGYRYRDGEIQTVPLEKAE